MKANSRHRGRESKRRAQLNPHRLRIPQYQHEREMPDIDTAGHPADVDHGARSKASRLRVTRGIADQNEGTDFGHPDTARNVLHMPARSPRAVADDKPEHQDSTT